MARQMKERSPSKMKLATFDDREISDMAMADIDWIARIVWASQ
jgi:hypothetical protein